METASILLFKCHFENPQTLVEIDSEKKQAIVFLWYHIICTWTTCLK